MLEVEAKKPWINLEQHNLSGWKKKQDRETMRPHGATAQLLAEPIWRQITRTMRPHTNTPCGRTVSFWPEIFPILRD